MSSVQAFNLSRKFKINTVDDMGSFDGTYGNMCGWLSLQEALRRIHIFYSPQQLAYMGNAQPGAMATSDDFNLVAQKIGVFIWEIKFETEEVRSYSDNYLSAEHEVFFAHRGPSAQGHYMVANVLEVSGLPQRVDSDLLNVVGHHRRENSDLDTVLELSRNHVQPDARWSNDDTQTCIALSLSDTQFDAKEWFPENYSLEIAVAESIHLQAINITRKARLVKDTAEPFADQWACPECSFHNSKLMLHCEMCNEQKDMLSAIVY